MMKKVLYGVALTLFAGVSVGSLQSCKDDLSDYQTQTSYDLTKLRGQLDAETARLEGLISAEKTAREADIAAVNREIAALKDADNVTAGKIDGLTSRLDNVEALLTNYDELASKAYVDGQCEALKEELKALLEAYSDEGDAALIEMIENAQKYAEWLDATLKDEIEEELDEIRDEIVKIENAIDSIIQHIDKQVTGILIQGVNSPVFGDFSLPIGVRSNMLFNWYGQNIWNEEFDFPSASETYSATGKPGLDLSKLNPTTYKVPAGYFGDADESLTFGTVYATINPVGAKFDHLDVNLETSAGTKLPWLVSLKPSNKELVFGYTRDGEEGEEAAGVEINAENGFYEGELVVPVEEAISSDYKIEVEIEQSLKTAMKDALKNPSMTTAKALVKGVYDQLSGKIPAYAMRYDWTTPGVAFEVDPGFSLNSYSVLSQYDLAVATSKPLSFNFLAGYEGSAKLPEIGHIQNIIDKIKEIGNFSFTFKPFKVDKFEVDLGTINLSAVNSDIKIEIPALNIKDENGNVVNTTEKKEITVTGADSGMKKMLEDLQSEINGTLINANGELKSQLDKLSANIESQVNDMMAEINDQVNGKINSIIDDATSKLKPYFGKIDKAIDLYNKIANKVNNFLTNPNAYLQVAAFYSMGSGNYGLVSGKASDPTPFVGNGQAFKLYLSSYTAELIVPACKKYVAITAAPEGADLAALNSGDLNKVLDGNQIVIEVAKPTVKGVYEFTYQALDYSGYTSTKKFYIEVK